MIEGELAARHDAFRDAGHGVDAAFARPVSLSAWPDLASLAVAEVVPALIERRPADPGMLIERLHETGRLAPRTVTAFAELLFDGFGSDCEDFALGHFARTGDPQRVAAELLEPAARLIGRHWCEDTRDFLRVTYAASRLQRLFWRIVQEAPPPRAAHPERCALLAPVPGEQHTFGLAVVEDALRRAGWEVDTCLPGEEDEMMRLAGANRYVFVGLSLSGSERLPAFARAAKELRRRAAGRDLRVVAGGSLFRDQPALAAEAGADHVCTSAASAVNLAESFLVSMRPECQMRVAAE